MFAAIDTTTITSALTDGVTNVETIGAAGLAIVGALIILKVIKKAANRAS